jgi:hypothetical protein
MKALALLLVFASASLAATAEGTFAARRSVADTAEREELAAIEFDRDVCRVTRDAFPDVRILAAEGQAIPFLVQRVTRSRSQWTESAQPARRTATLIPDPEGNRLEAVVEAPRPEAPAWIEIVTPIRDFEKRVSVFLPAPGNTWQALTENQAIYDYSRFMDVRRCRVLLPEAPAADRYRIVVSDVSDASASAFVELTSRSGGGNPDQETIRKIIRYRDFRIDRVDFGYRRLEERRDVPVWAEYPLHITATERDEKDGVTRLSVATERLPIAELRFAIGDRNVSRMVHIEVRRSLDDGTVQWQRLGQGTIYNLDFRDVREEAMSVALVETRATELRVVIVDRDSAPLTVQGITAVCPVYRALFLASPGVRYTLAYGDRDLAPPRFDTEVLQRLYERKDREVRTLGLTAVGEAAQIPRPGLLARAVNSRTTLMVALAAAVLVLGAATWSAARRIVREGKPAGKG